MTMDSGGRDCMHLLICLCTLQDGLYCSAAPAVSWLAGAHHLHGSCEARVAICHFAHGKSNLLLAIFAASLYQLVPHVAVTRVIAADINWRCLSF